MKDRIEALAEEIIQRHRIPDIVDSSVLYFEPDRDEIKEVATAYKNPTISTEIG